MRALAVVLLPWIALAVATPARACRCAERTFDPMQAGDARDFPDVISERALDVLTKLHVASETAARPIGGVALEGSLLGLVTLPMTFDRDLDEVVLETPYATVELRERPDAAAPIVRTVTGEADVRTREHAYEIEGAEVYGVRAEWLELRTTDGRAGWLRPPPGAVTTWYWSRGC